VKFTYKIVKIVNNKQVATIKRARHLNKLNEQFDKIINDNKKSFTETLSKIKRIKPEGVKLIEVYLALITDNTHMKSDGQQTNNDFKILKIERFFEVRKFFAHPEKKYIELNKKSLKDNKAFYRFKNKIIFNEINPLMIVCRDGIEAKEVIRFLINEIDLIYLGKLTKKMESELRNEILEKFQISKFTLYKEKTI